MKKHNSILNCSLVLGTLPKHIPGCSPVLGELSEGLRGKTRPSLSRLFMLTFASIFLAIASSYAQSSAAVRKLEQERKAALEEIELTNKLLEETSASAKSSLNRLNLLSQQIASRKKVISLLTQEMAAIDKQMEGMQQEIDGLQKELGEKKTNYGKSVQSLYRRQGSLDKLLFILSAEDFAQSLRRMRYLREYAEWQRMQAASIVDKQNEVSLKKGELEKTRAEKQALLTERETENQKLQTEESNQKQEVSQLNKKRKDLQAQLAKKRRQAEALNRQIEKLIAEEIARAEAAERARRKQAEAKKAAASEERVAETKGGYAMTKAERQLSGSFASNKGRLPYPVTGRHTVVATFGEQQHQELKYVRTNNSGIDIQTSPGADARAVFNGTVTRVFTLPGYNNSIIVRHGNYLTVYSNLSQVYVKAGDQVSTRQALGRIFTDTDDGNATILHFQLWKEKQKQNPLPWLE